MKNVISKDSLKSWHKFLKKEILCYKKSPFLEIMIMSTLSLIRKQYGDYKTEELIEKLKLKRFK